MKLPWSRRWAIISCLFGIVAAFTAFLYVPFAIIAGVLTSLTTLLSMFVSDYETYQDTPPRNPFGSTRVYSRKEQAALFPQDRRLPNFFEWFLGRSKPINLKDKGTKDS
jgi:hypothetical protein